MNSEPNELNGIPPEDDGASHARCVHARQCGGCTVQHVAYSEQVEEKKRSLVELFSDIVPSDVMNEFRVEPSPNPWRYRNKMEFTFKETAGASDDESDIGLVLGLHELGAYDRLIDLEMCHICPSIYWDILNEVRQFARDSGERAYNTDTFKGLWRFLQVRYSNATGDVLVEIFARDRNEELMRDLARLLAHKYEAIKSVYWSHTPGKADAAIPESTHLLVGAPFILERIGGIDLEVGPRTFVQPNVPLASKLYADLAEALDPKTDELLWDLYCGAGSIGMSLAGHVGQVLGLERNLENVMTAQEGAVRNHIENFICSRANMEKFFRGSRSRVPEGMEKPDLLVTDPPRAGLHQRVLNHVVRLNARRWVYVACRPESLHRDLVRLMAMRAPYRVAWMRSYDFFPHTKHVETVAALERTN